MRNVIGKFFSCDFKTGVLLSRRNRRAASRNIFPRVLNINYFYCTTVTRYDDTVWFRGGWLDDDLVALIKRYSDQFYSLFY